MACECPGNDCYEEEINGHKAVDIKDKESIQNMGLNNLRLLTNYVSDRGTYTDLLNLLAIAGSIHAGDEIVKQMYGSWGTLAGVISAAIRAYAKDNAICTCKEDGPTPPTPIAPPPSIPSPLILDLNGNGVETVGKDNGVYFDHEGDGFAEKSGWVGGGDGLLVWDRNGNGQIDGGSELFGNNYTFANGEKAANGFEALKDFDTNGDGIIDRNDELWSELRVWVDKRRRRC